MTQGLSLHSKMVLADATKKSMKLISYSLNFLDYSQKKEKYTKQRKEKKDSRRL